MIMLPNRYKTPGLHVWCNTHKKVVTSRQEEHSECNCVFQSRVYNPHTKKTDFIRSWDTQDPEEALRLHLEFKKELKSNNYLLFNHLKKPPPNPVILFDAVQRYLDWFNDLGVDEHEKKKRGITHIKQVTTNIHHFLDVIRKNGFNPRKMGVEIDSKVVGLYYDHLRYTQKNRYNENLSNPSINRYIGYIRAMYNYFQAEGIVMNNPFKKVTKLLESNDIEIIHEEELMDLFKVITKENGEAMRGNETRNYYRPWLVKCFKLALLTGARRSEICQLKWGDVGKHYITIINSKTSNRRDSLIRYTTPITSDLAKLLMEIGIGDDDCYILAPDRKNRDTLADFITHAFRHYWDLISPRSGVKFHSFRKTQLTRLRRLLGDKSNSLLTHAQLETQINHYLNKEGIIESLKDKSLFDLD